MAMRDLFEQLKSELNLNMGALNADLLGSFPVVIRVKSSFLKDLRPIKEFDEHALKVLQKQVVPKLSNLVSDVETIVTFDNVTIMILKTTNKKAWRKGKIAEISSVISSIMASELMKAYSYSENITVINEIKVANIMEQQITAYMAYEQLQAYNNNLDKELMKVVKYKDIAGKTYEEKVEQLKQIKGNDYDTVSVAATLSTRKYVQSGDRMKWKVTPDKELINFINRYVNKV